MLKNITLKSKKEITNIPKLSSKKSDSQTFSKSIDTKNPKNLLRNNILNFNSNSNVLKLITKSNLASSVSPRKSYRNNVDKKNFNSINIFNSYNPISQRTNIYNNKNFSREIINTETTYINTDIINSEREIKLPENIKNKVSNIRLYSKPRFKTTLINEPIKPLEKFKLNTINLNQNLNKQSIKQKKNNTVKSLSDINKNVVKPIQKNNPKDQIKFNVNNVNNKNRIFKKPIITKKHFDYQNLCENENRPNYKFDKEIVFNNSQDKSDGALSVNEVQDIIKVFEFEEIDIYDKCLFETHVEETFKYRKDKYYDYLFKPFVDSREFL